MLTYLANDIEKVSGQGTGTGQRTGEAFPTRRSPRSIRRPADRWSMQMGKPLPPLADDEIVLTSWAAEDQKAKVGDRIRVTYFEPETTHGEEREASAEFRVEAIVPLTEPKSGFTRRGPAVYDQRPTPANDPDLTPEVKGITDQASIADWDPPFPFDDKRIRKQDETYWENHRTTPKAYVSLATGQQLWGSRFGNVTSFRIPAAAGVTAESLEQQFLDEVKRSGERLGLDFSRSSGRDWAASGTTPFDVLFLLLSMFIIAAALMLVWLLFRLGVEQRADEIGLLLALGWSRPKVRRLFLLEGGVVAAVGAALGVVLGVGYAWLMLAGLRTWWVGAIASPFLTLHVAPLSLVVGFVAGLVVSLVTIWFSLGRVKRAVVRSLLAGEIVPSTKVRSTQYRVSGRSDHAHLARRCDLFRRGRRVWPSMPRRSAARRRRAFHGGGGGAARVAVAGYRCAASLGGQPEHAARRRGAGPAGVSQCGPQRRPQRGDDRPDGFGGVFDRRRQRLSDESDGAGRRRLRSAGRKLAADL